MTLGFGSILFFSFLAPQNIETKNRLFPRPESSKSLTPSEQIKLSSFPEHGVYFLEDITIDQLTGNEARDEQGSPSKLDRGTDVSYSFDYKKIIIDLLNQTNESVIRILAEKLDPAYRNETDLTLLQTKINQALEEVRPTPAAPQQGGSTKQGGITSTLLFEKKNGDGVILRKADVVNVYTIEVGDEAQRMIRLEGNVLLYFGSNSLEAERVALNIKTKEIHAEGKIKLKINQDLLFGERILLNIKKQMGYLFDVAGMQQGFYFEGKLLKINRKGHYTLEQGWVTFSSNADPYYTVAASQFDTYGKDKSIYENAVIYVHNQPFFWIPYFIRYPVSTGLNMVIGETRREGYYALTRMEFKPEVFNQVTINFNVYEKLGSYLSLKNKNTILNTSYDLFLVGVRYTENSVTREKPDKLTYSHNTSPYLSSVSSFRHKLEYTHKIDLAHTDSQFKSTLDFSLKQVSDPFISSTFPLALTHFDLRKMIERHDRDEILFTASPSDRNAYDLKYNFSAPQTSLGIDLNWKYDVYEDPNKREESVDERYQMYLKNRTLPRINFNVSGNLDPYRSDSDKPFHFNTAYQASLGYNATSVYKDGTPRGEGSGLLTNLEPYQLSRENYDFNLAAEIKRSFSVDKDQSSLIDFNLPWFDWEWSPAFKYTFAKKWKGKDYTTSDNTKDDREDQSLNYSIASVMNFNKSIPTFFDLNLNNSWSLSRSSTVFRYDPDDRYNEDWLENVERLNTSSSLSIGLNFPSGSLKHIWANSYSYHSMLPVLNWNLIQYTISRSTSQEEIDAGKYYELDQYVQRKFSSKASAVHNGYGFLYLRDFDYILTSSVGLGYNLLPDKDEKGISRNTSLLEKDLWNAKRFTEFSGSTSLNFDYKVWKWNHGFSYIFFRADTQEVDPVLTRYNNSSSVVYSREDSLNPWLNWTRSTVNFDWSYHFQPGNYRKDRMKISFQNSFNFLQLFNVAFSLSSFNDQPYLYFKNKANHLDESHVNLFQDLLNSLGFFGTEGRMSSLFKMNSVSMSIWHDLDDWFLNLNYLMKPVTYREGSFRGFYFDHQISFEVNLKKDRDPRGASEAMRDPFFENLEKNLVPTGFEK